MSLGQTERTVTITLFSDPMQGLAYECQPFFDALAKRYGHDLELRHAMVVLVRDVADFMTPEEQALPPAEGIARYNERLAQIYLSEEPIGDVPMNMEGFCLFDEAHRSSEPLCLAFEAVRLVAPERAEAFLHLLRTATIVEARPTTHLDELRLIGAEAGVDLDAFDRALADGSVRAALSRDEALAAAVGICGLPTRLVEGARGALLVSPVTGYRVLEAAVERVR